MSVRDVTSSNRCSLARSVYIATDDELDDVTDDVGVHRKQQQVSAVAEWRGGDTLKGNDLVSSAPLFVVNRASDSRQWRFY